MESKTILGLSGLAFMLLCFLCVYRHGPQLAAARANPTSPVSTAVQVPQLEAKVLQNKVTLTGTLPDQAAKEQVLARARALYGAGQFTENLTVSNQTAFPQTSWLPSALALFPLVKQTNNEGSFVIRGNTVTVRGMLDNETARAALLTSVATASGPEIKVADATVIKGQVTAAQAADFQQKLDQMLAGKIVEFETGSEVITPKGKEVLAQIGQVLAQVPGVPVEVGGHTDAGGAAALNLSLSQRRAEACRQYLLQQGVAATRLSAHGYGATQPLADNQTPEGQQRNRRIEFTVLKEGK